MDDEELALKILDRYTTLKRDLGPEELTDAYFSILGKVRSSSSSSYSSAPSVTELPGISMEMPSIPETLMEMPSAPEQSPDFSIFEQTTEAVPASIPEKVGFFDLALNTETLCKTDFANETVPEKKYISPEEKDMLDDEKY